MSDRSFDPVQASAARLFARRGWHLLRLLPLCLLLAACAAPEPTPTATAVVAATATTAAAAPAGTPAPTIEPSPTPDPVIAALQAQIDSILSDENLSGIVLGLDRPGQAPLLLTSGGDDPVSGYPLTTEMRFGVADVTKTFVAAAVLQLADEGALALDDPLAVYMPFFPYAAQVTIRQLLAHQTGLVSQDSAGDWRQEAIGDLARKWTWSESIAFSGAEPLLFEPGSEVADSDANYTLLAGVIEGVTGEPLADVLRSRFFEPLGLNDTYLSGFEAIPGGYQTGYFDCDSLSALEQAYLLSLYGLAAACTEWGMGLNDLPLASVETAQYGAIGIVSNATDLLTWGRALYTGDVLSPAAQAAMYEFQLWPEKEISLGLGVQQRSSPVGDIIGHSGREPGATQLWYVPELDVVFLIWSSRFIESDSVAAVLDLLPTD